VAFSYVEKKKHEQLEDEIVIEQQKDNKTTEAAREQARAP
jgi:hypothetical protein